MNKKLYKSSFNDITVSEDILNEVISKAVLIQDKKTGKPAKYTKLLILAAAFFATSAITVTAVSYLGVTDVFRDFYSQFFKSETPEFTQSQKDFLEKHGTANIGGFSKDGVNLNIEGLIGDRNYLFLKYSLSYDYDHFIYSDVPELYIEDETKMLHPAGCSSSHQLDKVIPYKINYATLFEFDPDKLHSAENATFIMTNKASYQPVHINLSETYNKYGISAPVNSQGFFDTLSEGKVNTPFDNEFGGKIILNSLGFADNSMTLIVDSSRYYKRPELFLRNKKTGMIYSECNGFNFALKLGSDSYSFKVESIDMLKDLEIVMPKEFHYKFPLSYVDSTRNVDLSKLSSLVVGNIKIARFNISPLSLSIDGYFTGSKRPEHSIYFTIKLKDGTESDDFKNHSGSKDADGSFNMKVPFESPVILDSIKSVVIKYGDETMEIPIKQTIS